MTNLREKAREIKAAGEAERGNFEPRGVPKRMYSYWLDESNSRRAKQVRRGERRENFCHFWRVVAIWAPLMFLRRKAERLATNPVFLSVVGLAGLIAFIYICVTNTGFLMGLLFLLGCFAAVAAVMGIGVFVETQIDKRAKDPHKVKERIAVVSFGIMLGFLILLACAVLISAAGLVTFAAVVVTIAAVVGACIVLAPKVGAYFERMEAKERERVSAAVDAYIRGEGPNPYEKVKKEPGRIARFANGVVDFFVLIAQASRAKKWKICPLVEIDR